MTKTNLYRNIMAIFLALMLCNHAIRSVLYVNFIYIYFSGALTFFIILKIKKTSSLMRMNIIDIIILIFAISLILYSSISTILNGKLELNKVFELSVLFLVYFISREIERENIKVIVNIVFFWGLLHSIFLIVDRNYVYSAGINYLLMSFSIGLSCCISYIKMFYHNDIKNKVILLSIFIITWAGLFAMQSRAVFLFTLFYCTIFPFFILKGKNKIYFTVISSFILIFIIAYFYNDIVYFYENSKIYQRMSELQYDYQNEPRVLTYSLFFDRINEFWISGYGLNGTGSNIYKYTIEKYPHNFIFEFWSDFGLLGLIFSIFFSFFPLIFFLKRKFDETLCIASLIYLYYLMNFMKSFSIYDSSMFFLSVGLFYAIAKNYNNDSYNK
ncbi:O-antigen ligase family protein [Providencia rettgeri]|uniref:O-antigen ligase family protein n=1 Tax=Providencia rettgeri TaxID=587 RepID=UPI0018E48489|nr:O-antigen ligase family protein [Providencia rettgeri]MBI6203896.1 O-antigen ligase family protein [Providencia rettgeri]